MTTYRRSAIVAAVTAIENAHYNEQAPKELSAPPLPCRHLLAVFNAWWRSGSGFFVTFPRLIQVWEHPCRTSTERLVLWALASYANAQDRCWPSLATLQKRTGLSERSIQLSIKSLVASGSLAIENKGGGRHLVNSYRVDAGKGAPDTVNDIQGIPNGVTGSRKGAPHAGNGAPRAPQLIRNRERTGKAPLIVYDREIQSRIDAATNERNKLRLKYCLEHSLDGPTWTSQEAKSRVDALGLEISSLKKKLAENHNK